MLPIWREAGARNPARDHLFSYSLLLRERERELVRGDAIATAVGFRVPFWLMHPHNCAVLGIRYTCFFFKWLYRAVRFDINEF